mgnify:CR=1 FL=1
MKKILTISLALIMIFVLTACGTKIEMANNVNDNSQKQQDTNQKEE